MKYLDAVVAVLDDGKPVNPPNLAVELGVTRQAVWKYQRENPVFVDWVNAQLEAASRCDVGPILRRLGQIAMRGSVDHAKLVLQFHGRLKEKVDHRHQVSLLELLAPEGDG